MSEGENSCGVKDSQNFRIEKLEKDVNALGEKVGSMDKLYSVELSKISISLSMLQELPKTLQEMSKTMIKLQDTVMENSRHTGELADKVDNLSGKVDKQHDEFEDFKTEPMKDQKEIKQKAITSILGNVGTAIIVSILTVFCTLVAKGMIKL